jgi:hypothetical protein
MVPERCLQGPSPGSGEQRLDERRRGRTEEVDGLLPHPDEAGPGLPEARASIAKTMPALGVESSLVRTDPAEPTLRGRPGPGWSPFWPVVASRTNRRLRAGRPASLVDDPPIFVSSSISFAFVWRRPAGIGDDEVGAAGDRRVERVVDRPRRGRAGACETDLDAARSAQIRSWSIAGSANVSAAARSTCALGV